MADAATRPSDDRPNDNPILGFFSNFVKLLNLPPLPFAPKTKQPKEPADKTGPVVAADSAVTETKSPPLIKFPRGAETSLPSVKLEPDEVEERNTNPVVLWQVYAIGGFLVLRWAWTRWNERRERKKPSDEDPPPTVE